MELGKELGKELKDEFLNISRIVWNTMEERNTVKMIVGFATVIFEKKRGFKEAEIKVNGKQVLWVNSAGEGIWTLDTNKLKIVRKVLDTLTSKKGHRFWTETTIVINP